MKYKVYGRKHQDFIVTVSATSPQQAAEIANSLESHLWAEIENDDVIEAISVELYELGNR